MEREMEGEKGREGERENMYSDSFTGIHPHDSFLKFALNPSILFFLVP